MQYRYEHLARKRVMKKMILATLIATMGVATGSVYATSASYGTAWESGILEEVAILETVGWLESAAVTWEKAEGVDGYNVYYKMANESDRNYTQLDTELIREYDAYFRADVLGLKEGEYVLQIVPLQDGKEVRSAKAQTRTISVMSHTREGFAFSKESPMGTGSGGYEDDGSISEVAQVMYITADTVNTVQLDVITSSKGKVTTVTGLTNILSSRQKGYDQRPLIIRMVGMIKDTDIIGLNSSGYIQLKGLYNVTLEGVGEDATINGWGLLIRDSHNVEIRNLGVMLFKDDAISLDTNNENIWVHHNDIFYGEAGSDSDQAKGDGSADVKGFSNYVTISYNHFWDSGKSSLCGMSDSKEFFVTYHHNWFDHSDSRHPRIRVGSVHIYNNYFDGNSKYGVGVTKGSSAFVEANDFRNCKYPMLSSLQGSDIAGGGKGNFSSEAGGMIKAYNNQISGEAALVYQTQDSVQFDAYLAASREEIVPATFSTVSGSNTYNNFDTSTQMYAYTPDAPEVVREVVTTYAGRMNGGDFTWTFTAADDTDYGVNKALMSKIRGYQSAVVSIGGNSIVDAEAWPEVPTLPEPEVPTPPEPEVPSIPEPEVPTPPEPEVPSEEWVWAHNFTEKGKDSEILTIKGNLSTSKGTRVYKELLLTTCLKIESATEIYFTANQAGTLTLVLEEGSTKKIAIDDEIYQAVDGILTVALAEGAHQITKVDTGNLYYIEYTA